MFGVIAKDRTTQRQDLQHPLVRDPVQHSFIRNALAQGVTVELLDIRQVGDYVLAVLQASRQDEDEPLAPHTEFVSIRDGKIIAIIVYENVEQALNAAA